MGSKQNPGQYDCYANALPDEPMFILLGRDPVAPDCIMEWARRREIDIDLGRRPESDRAMIVEARGCAVAMMKWRRYNEGKWRGEGDETPAPIGHEWVASTHGHGETMCKHCLVTNREAAVLGWTDKPCERRAKTEGGS